MDVLLVDTSVTTERLAAELGGYGMRVSWVRSMAAADGVLRQQQLSGVVLEAVLNGASTLDFMDSIRARFPHAAVVFVTCYPSLASAQAAIRRGADDYLAKPVAADELAAILSRRERTSGVLRPLSLAGVRREYLREITSRYSSLAEAARVLGLDRRSLRRMLERHGLRKHASSRSPAALTLAAEFGLPEPAGLAFDCEP